MEVRSNRLLTESKQSWQTNKYKRQQKLWGGNSICTLAPHKDASVSYLHILGVCKHCAVDIHVCALYLTHLGLFLCAFMSS